jgi:hypothetical protein
VVHQYQYEPNGQPMKLLPYLETYGYTVSNSSGMNSGPQYPLINGSRILGLLSTPKYVFWSTAKPAASGYYSNNVVAYMRSMSGPAYEKYPQNNPAVQDFAFCYRMTSEVVPYGTNYYNPAWTLLDTNYAAVVNNLSNNLHDVRLTFRWPLRSNGQLGPGGQAFRTLVGGQLLPTFEPTYPTNNPAYNLYFFQPRTYMKAL